MTKRFPISIVAGVFAVPILLFGAASFAQKPDIEKVKQVLRDGAGFGQAEFDTLEKGDIVVKKLEVTEDREVAFCGVLKLDAPRDVVVDAFRRAIERQQKQVSEEYGVYRNPPETSDLTKLTIKDSEIRGLRDCKPGDCKWSLSSDLIERFAGEIDWTAEKAEDQGEAMVKQMLVENVKGYLSGGDKALMVYNDDPTPLSVADEMSSLTNNLLWINDFAPEFTEYLKSFPNGRLDGIEDQAMWSKVKVAFKPVIINTHTIFYRKDSEGVPQCLIVSKQIYANHYFNSSLSLTGIISFPNADGSFSTYIFFVSHSRTGALTGAMGGFTRVAIDGEAETKLADVLNDTKRYTAYGTLKADPAEVVEAGILARVFRSSFVWILVILIVLAAGIWFVLRRARA